MMNPFDDGPKVPPAPWSNDFKAHMLAAHPDTEFSFSTISPSGHPHVRYCGHRGFWATPSPQEALDYVHKPNPPIYQSDCPIFLTDARMEKVRDIFGTDDSQACLGSGGGGRVEAAYWIRGDIRTEWRIRGRAWILGVDDIESDQASAVREAVGKYMRPVPVTLPDAEGVKDNQTPLNPWSCQREISDHYARCPPFRRGSYKHPPPGTSRSQPPGSGEGMGLMASPVDNVARKYFRIVVITPLEVERIDLKDPMDDRRWIWRLEEDSNRGYHWEEEELWP